MDINSTNSNVDIEQDNVDAELSSDIPQISLKTKSSINIEVPGKKEINIETPKVENNKNHANMKNLDYENSGHTGFASSKDIENINNELLNKANKNEIPDISEFVKDSNYVHTDNNFTNENKTKLDSLTNFSGNATDVNYEDNYGYGGSNVQEALDIAFETLDGTPNYSDLNNYVSYNTQPKTESQQRQARKNIGIPSSCVLYNQNQSLTEINKLVARNNIEAKRAIKYLGEVDLSQYNDDVFEFISTLTSEGEYKFVDSYDGFTWLVNVVQLGDYLVGQSYCCSEEGYGYIYYRSGYYDENTDTYSWNNWISFLTSSQAKQLFALKNHVHYNNVTTAYTIRTYLDGFTGNGDYRITSNLDKEIYIFSGYYYNVTVNGVTQYRRSQRYYSISEPWKVYSRFGLYNTSTKKITWNAWHVTEGVEE